MNNVRPLAGRFRRLAATIIDAILVPSMSLVLLMVTDVMEDAEDYVNLDLMLLWIFLLAIAAYIILNGYTLWHKGQTLGKWLLGIAIVSAWNHPSTGELRGDNESMSEFVPAPFWKLIFIRALFFPVLFLSVVPWVALLPVLDQALIFGKRRRCLHDLVAGTVVVRV